MQTDTNETDKRTATPTATQPVVSACTSFQKRICEHLAADDFCSLAIMCRLEDEDREVKGFR